MSAAVHAGTAALPASQALFALPWLLAPMPVFLAVSAAADACRAQRENAAAQQPGGDAAGAGSSAGGSASGSGVTLEQLVSAIQAELPQQVDLLHTMKIKVGCGGGGGGACMRVRMCVGRAGVCVHWVQGWRGLEASPAVCLPHVHGIVHCLTPFTL